VVSLCECLLISIRRQPAAVKHVLIYAILCTCHPGRRLLCSLRCSLLAAFCQHVQRTRQTVATVCKRVGTTTGKARCGPAHAAVPSLCTSLMSKSFRRSLSAGMTQVLTRKFDHCGSETLETLWHAKSFRV